ncbi:MAG: cadmium-translocating P-type ATPase [Oscillospiraceae bacterium]|jgi:Cd2+/Zn2+-exporting ATPase|nr:cadmium-translocating P-type ATPase [Oscillospiraceae bacterium]
MERVFLLNGLCCGVCGGKIENAVRSLPGIESAKLNMANAALTVLPGSFAGDVRQAIMDITARIEPDVTVLEEGEPPAAPPKHVWRNRALLRILIGAGLFGIGLLLPYIWKTVPAWIGTSFCIASYVIMGWKVLWSAIKNIAHGELFDENFLMALATIGAFALKETPEAAGVMLLYQIGEYFQGLAVERSRKSITALMDIRPDTAETERGGAWKTIPPEDVVPGEVILVRPGGRIPLDGVVENGASALDTSALTGEAVPRYVGVGDTVLSGCVNQSGVLRLRVTKPFGESTVSKIIEMVEHAASRKSQTENFITRFAKWYTPIVVICGLLVAVVPPLFFHAAWAQWVQRALVFLLISCPCALVISIPLGFFGGVGACSRKGVLVKGSNYLEALAALDTVVFDKTGTLTKGSFRVTDIRPAPGFTAEELLQAAAVAESYSTHPIAAAVRAAYNAAAPSTAVYQYTEIPGQGVCADAAEQTLLAGNRLLLDSYGIAVPDEMSGTAVVYVAVNGRFAGMLSVADEPKPDAHAAISALRRLGVRRTAVLTGDSAGTAQEICRTFGVDECRMGLLPGDKLEILENLLAEKPPKGKLAFVGDGINDAPVLARADVGIAMGGMGTDAAIAASDVVLMTDEPSKLLEAVRIARFTRKIVWQNIVFALGTEVLFMTLGAMGMLNMWWAVMSDVGVMLLSVLNVMRIIRMK